MTNQIYKNKIMKIGITGGTGSGKSSVCRYLEDMGFQVIDSDAIARQILENDSDAYKTVVSHFGKSILSSNGEINRKVLGSIVFASSEELDFLQNVVTKKTIEKVIQIMHTIVPEKKFVFLDAPILFEVGLDKYVDRVWMVLASREQRIKRLSKRDGISDFEIEKRMAAQMPEDEKKKLSDDIILNNGTLYELHLRVDELLEDLI